MKIFLVKSESVLSLWTPTHTLKPQKGSKDIIKGIHAINLNL